MTEFPDATINKRICFLNFWLTKSDKNIWILPFTQLHLSTGNDPKVWYLLHDGPFVLRVQSLYYLFLFELRLH